MVLFSLKQGKKIIKYIWKFELVIIQFVENLFMNDIFIYYIQRFNNERII